MKELETLGPGLWLQRHPLSLLGCAMGRNVCLIRLASGRILIHSSARFDSQDRAAIAALGEPAWLLEATNFHDTCAAAGQEQFGDLPYLTPEGFRAPAAVRHHQVLDRALPEWKDEISVVPIRGMPSVNELALVHHPSRTLIVADLFFNLDPGCGSWTLAFMRLAAGMRSYPAMGRLFRLSIKDREAFSRSMEEMARHDFVNLVVGHGSPILGRGREEFLRLLGENGFLPAES